MREMSLAEPAAELRRLLREQPEPGGLLGASSLEMVSTVMHGPEGNVVEEDVVDS
jgi:hypothetical protein